MKTTLLSSSLVLAFAGNPALAETPPKSELLQAVTALAEEFKQFSGKSAQDPVATLKQMEAHQYAPATRELLARTLGDADALKVRRLAGAPNELVYGMSLKAHSYTESGGDAFSWSDMAARMEVGKSGATLKASGDMQFLRYEGKDVRVELKGLHMSSDQHRGAGKQWLGGASFTVDRISVNGKSTPAEVTMENMTARADVSQRGKNSDIAYDFRIQAVKAASEQVDKVHMGIRITGLDTKTMQAFAMDASMRESNLTPQQQLERLAPRLRKLGSAMIRSGAAVEIDDISASYKGNTASIKGRLSMAGAREADLKSFDTFIKKINLRLDFRVPVALIKDVSLSFATKQQQTQSPNQPNEAAAAQAAQSMTDVVLGKALGEGYARMDKDALVSTIAFKNGKLTINGKPLNFPNMGKGPAPVPAAAVADPTTLPAREISDGCERASLPAASIAEGRTLRTTVDVGVGADGKVSDVRIVRSSGVSEFDAAVVKSAGSCSWVPALKGGQEVAVRVGQLHAASPQAPQASVTTVGR